jgi:hypothetical protein
MKTQNFTTTISVDGTPEQAFAAINNVRAWWTGQVEGKSEQEGDEFTYRYQKFHYSKQKVTELIPGKKVVWLVLESQLNFVENKSEWTGTEIIFDITPAEHGTHIRFTHAGLTPALECFDDCKNGWSDYLHTTLVSLVNTGQAQPELLLSEPKKSK